MTFLDRIRGGTIVTFTTTGGAINGDCELDDEGACSVTWVSQNPRPADGRIVILARSVGDESFKDLNSNGIFEDGENLAPFGERGEAFHDENRNGLYDAGEEQYFGDNANGIYDGPDGVFDGSACPDGSDPSRCTKGPVTVWADVDMIMANGSSIYIEMTNPEGTKYCATAAGNVRDGRTPMPTGTIFDFEIGTNGEITSARTSFTVPNKYEDNDYSGRFCVSATGPDVLTVTVTPPGGGDGVQETISVAAP